jgi:hypothetical protein
VLQEALLDVASYALPDNLDGLKAHLNPDLIEEALCYAGVASIRRRRLPAEQVVWLVIGMALYRREPIERIVEKLDLAVPDQKGTLLAKSAIAQARQRLKDEALEYLFTVTAAEWSARSADAHRWRGYALYGWDGTTLRVPDSPENREEFGGQRAGGGRGDSGYPMVRVVAAMALRSHVLSDFRVADYGTGETTLARGLWSSVPDNSLVIFDRNFLIKHELVHFEMSGNKHWLSRSKVNTRWASVKRLGTNDELVELETQEPGIPTWQLRAIHYKRKGFPRATLLTSLLDPTTAPAKELIALYHERWELELGYDELKTHMLDRQEAIRSRTPDGVRQELWGLAIAYNLIRLEMERVANLAKVAPTRISFVAAMGLIKDELAGLVGQRLALGTIPSRLAFLEQQLKRLVLPERRTHRSYPRAVKRKMSNYPRKRPRRRVRK